MIGWTGTNKLKLNLDKTKVLLVKRLANLEMENQSVLNNRTVIFLMGHSSKMLLDQALFLGISHGQEYAYLASGDEPTASIPRSV